MVREYLHIVIAVTLLLLISGCGSSEDAPSTGNSLTQTASEGNSSRERAKSSPTETVPSSFRTDDRSWKKALPPEQSKSESPRRNIPEIPQTEPEIRRFVLEDLDHRRSAAVFEGERVRFEKIRQRVVVLTLLSDRCAPCRGMMPYLTMLQKKYAKDLFVLGVLVRSDLDGEELRRFMRRHGSNYYLSNHPDGDRLGAFLASRLNLGSNYPLPLTLIYKDGKYIMHIQGAVPYEMLSRLVEELIQP